MSEPIDLEELFEQAVARFPYPGLRSVGCAQGDLVMTPGEPDDYVEDFTFTAGFLLDEPLTGVGCIQIGWDAEGTVTIIGDFRVALWGNWYEEYVLPEDTSVAGVYDIPKRVWTFEIKRRGED